LAIVVSEERGQVMVACDGATYQIRDNLELEQLLKQHQGNTPVRRDLRMREKLEFTLAGILCLMCVTGIWFSFARGLETMVNLSVPVEYMNRSSQMEIMDTSVNSVNLILGGSGALIKSLTNEHVKVKIDLAGAVAGVNAFSLTKENIDLPPGIIFKKIDPTIVDVVLDLPVQKILPVQVDWVGKLSEDLIMESLAVEPEVVSLVGGSQSMENLNTIYTEKISLDNIKASDQMTVNLALHPAGLKFAGSQREKVLLRFTIKRRSAPPDALSR